MISTRSMVLAALIGLPVLLYAAVGGYAIWQSGSFGWVWWLMTGCGLAAWGVSRIWPARPTSSRTQHHLSAPQHWTPRDQDAAQVIRDYQLRVESHSAEELTDPQFYLRQVESLAMDLARLYHPQATDPLEQLTVPETLAAVRLAVDDMERWMLESVPGSRMLTIRQWQMLQSAPLWMQRISETAWAASILLNPANIARYFASKWSWDPVTEQLQSEVLAVVYLRFIRQVGYYLVEMNSGRLRGGADAYRSAFGTEQQKDLHRDGRRPLEHVESPPITIALVGQVSSGKSSLINLLTGEAQAAVDVLPETSDVGRYQWTLGDPPVTLTLLDTPGYGESGASQQQVRQIHRALEASDAALLVMDAHSPAREADRQTLEQLQSMSRTRPHLKPPAIVGVLTHVDLLSPSLEWSPPYDWRTPGNPKARSLHDAVAYVSELFHGSLVQTVPVCSDSRSGRQWGAMEELLPALVELLDEVHSVALLRAYEMSLDQRRWKTLLRQVARSGRQLLEAWIDERLQNPARAD
jgi:predicted GTPase